MPQDPDARASLLAALDDADEEVRAAAVRALDALEREALPGGADAGVNVAIRPIRVFVSSTFRDMQAERDLLAKQVFPEVRQRCRELGGDLVPVDLRWGVTEKQAERGDVLAICLAEIEQCRPYFLGLLGERYGTVPSELDAGLLNDQDWLRTAPAASTTELEIRHGVLNNPAMMAHAFFYFRDPAFARNMPEAERPMYQAEDDAAADRVAALKRRIVAAGLTVRANYPDPPALAALVRADLLAAAERDYPAVAPDPLTRERIGHEAYGAGRSQAYVPLWDAFGRLDEHAAGDGPPLLVLGSSGAGKSALLANWARHHRHNHPEDLVIVHHAGATSQSTDAASFMRRILAELAQHLGITEPLPETLTQVTEAFPRWLDLAARTRRIVLVLDGLDQLTADGATAELYWLPEHLPARVRMVIATLPGRALEVLNARGWLAYTVPALGRLALKRLVYGYLATFNKRLSNARVDRLVDAATAHVPLYLRAILEELRVFGSHERLDDIIGAYVAAPDLDALYLRILERLEQDHDRERPHLVRDALTMIWASRGGLAEDELLALLGDGDTPLPRLLWSPLYLALDEALMNRSGQLTFFHEYLRRAVQNRYLAEPGSQDQAHRRLASFFAGQEPGSRRWDELPWQFQQSRDWTRLAALLSDVDTFAALWAHDEFAVRRYWATLSSASGMRPADAYRNVLDQPSHYERHLRDLSILLEDAGDPDGALTLRDYQVTLYRETGQTQALASALNNQAQLLFRRGELRRAKDALEEALAIHRSHGGSDHDIIAALNSLAVMLRADGQHEEALAVLGDLERLCRADGEDEDSRVWRDPQEKALMAVLGNQGVLLHELGRWDEALARQRERARIAARCNNQGELAAALGAQANVLTHRGRLAEAMQLHRQEEAAYRDLGDLTGLQGSLGNQGQILLAQADLTGALALARQQADLCRRIQHPEGLTAALLLAGIVEVRLGRPAEATATLAQAEQLARSRGDKMALHSALSHQAALMRTQGRLDQALALQRQAATLCEELGDRRGLQTALGNQGNILRDLGDLQGALQLYQQKIAICDELGYPAGKALGLANQSFLHAELGDAANAAWCAYLAREIIGTYGLKDLDQQVGRTLDRIIEATSRPTR